MKSVLAGSRIGMVVALGAVALTSGCASVTGSPNQSVSVQTRLQSGKEVVGSACELTNNKGKWFVTTPGSVSIHRSNDDLQVVCNKDGMDPGRAAVVSDTKGSMFGNIILGGGIGAIIDHNNGSAYEYPNFIQVVMGIFTKLELPKLQEGGGTTSGESGSPQSSAVALAASVPKTKLTKEQRLEELKSLFDRGLVANDAYLDQQRAILASD